MYICLLCICISCFFFYIYPEVHITRCEEVDGGDGLEPRGRFVGWFTAKPWVGYLKKTLNDSWSLPSQSHGVIVVEKCCFMYFFLLKQYHRNIDKNTIALSCSRNEWLDPDMSGGGLALFCVGSRGGRLVGCCVCLSEFLLMFVLNAVPPWIPASYGALPYFQIHLCGLVFSRTQLQMSGPKIEEPGRFHKWLKKT